MENHKKAFEDTFATTEKTFLEMGEDIHFDLSWTEPVEYDLAKEKYMLYKCSVKRHGDSTLNYITVSWNLFREKDGYFICISCDDSGLVAYGSDQEVIDDCEEGILGILSHFRRY